MMQQMRVRAAAWLMWLVPVGAAWGQFPASPAPLQPAAHGAAVAPADAGRSDAAAWDAAGLPPMMTACCADAGCGWGAAGCGGGPSLYGSVDFLLVRPHFSEAMAFATLDGAPPRVDGRELQFGYEPSFRARLGTWLAGGSHGLRATYWYFDGDTTANGTAAGTLVIVDPFGNIAAADARIGTRAGVRMNVLDLEFVSAHDWDGGCTTLAWTVGARIADVDQGYTAAITAGGVPVSFGEFTAEFIGAGPRMGLEAAHRCRPCSPLSLVASVHGSLLLGEYDVRSRNANVMEPLLNGAQRQSLTRMIPVVEMELGAAWQASDRLSLAAGWLFQAWFDLGTSGGRFAGIFNGADDANIMSFDGLFVRAELGF